MNIPEEIFKNLPREVQVYISKLEYDLWHDELTGLTSRKPFIEICEYELAHLRRSRTKGFALMFVDINGFKQLNDSYGHGLGDKALVLVADILRKSVRTADIVGRYGGDEFVILAQDIISAEEILPIIDRLKVAFKENFIMEEKSVKLGLSMGISFASPETISVQQLIIEADVLMYSAKKDKLRYPVCYKMEI